jgi:hypothetical protein
MVIVIVRFVAIWLKTKIGAHMAAMVPLLMTSVHVDISLDIMTEENHHMIKVGRVTGKGGWTEKYYRLLVDGCPGRKNLSNLSE